MQNKKIYNATLKVSGTGDKLESITMDIALPELELSVLQNTYRYWRDFESNTEISNHRNNVILSFRAPENTEIFRVQMPRKEISVSLTVDAHATVREIKELAGAPTTSTVYFEESQLPYQSVKKVRVEWKE